MIGVDRHQRLYDCCWHCEGKQDYEYGPLTDYEYPKRKHTEPCAECHRGGCRG